MAQVVFGNDVQGAPAYKRTSQNTDDPHARSWDAMVMFGCGTLWPYPVE